MTTRQRRQARGAALLLAAAIGTALSGCAGQAVLPECPQSRTTDSAPAGFLQQQNPVPATRAALDAGEQLYREQKCAYCHGAEGDGTGPLQFKPRPRNFTCVVTMSRIPDGQLFWVIRNGSPGTAMPPHPALADGDIWQLVHLIRHIAQP